MSQGRSGHGNIEAKRRSERKIVEALQGASSRFNSLLRTTSLSTATLSRGLRDLQGAGVVLYDPSLRLYTLNPGRVDIPSRFALLQIVEKSRTATTATPRDPKTLDFLPIVGLAYPALDLEKLEKLTTAVYREARRLGVGLQPGQVLAFISRETL